MCGVYFTWLLDIIKIYGKLVASKYCAVLNDEPNSHKEKKRDNDTKRYKSCDWDCPCMFERKEITHHVIPLI